MKVKLVANVNVSHEKCADDLAYNVEKIKQAATVNQHDEASTHSPFVTLSLKASVHTSYIS